MLSKQIKKNDFYSPKNKKGGTKPGASPRFRGMKFYLNLKLIPILLAVNPVVWV